MPSFVGAFVGSQRLAPTIGGHQLFGVLAPTSPLGSVSAAASTCDAGWGAIAGSAPTIHGAMPRGAPHARTSTVMTTARSHAPERCCPELEPPAERPSAVARGTEQAPRAARVKAAEGARGAGRRALIRASTVPRLAGDGGAAPTVLVAWSQPAAAGICGDEAADCTFP